MSTAPTRFEIDADADDVVHAESRILCIVPSDDDRGLLPSDDDRGLPVAIDAALVLAARHGASLLYYDRSQETWADTDHSGIEAVADMDLGDEPHLASAIAAAHEAGIPVQVWRSTMPALGSGLMNAIQRGEADVLVVPDAGGTERPVADQVAGSADGIADTARELLDKPLATGAGADIPIVTVSPEGRIAVAGR